MMISRHLRLVTSIAQPIHVLRRLPTVRPISVTQVKFEEPQGPPPSGSGRGRAFLLSLIVGGAAGGIYAFSNRSKQGPKKQTGNEFKPDEYLLSQQPPEFPPARVISVPGDTTGLKITLYQYQTCPFCCKVRAFLDYFGLSYSVIEVNSVTRRQVKWSSYKKVPILVVETPDGKVWQLNDSSLIISAMSSFLSYPSQSFEGLMSCYPKLRYTEDETEKKKEDFMNKYALMFKDIPRNRTKDDILNEKKWRQWADNSLVHMLSPNVYRTREEALQAFHWFNETGNWEKHFATWERYLVIYVGALAMWIIGKRLKKRHNLKDEVRESLYDDCNHWIKSIKRRNKGPFMGGQKPDLSDLAVYGCLSAIEGCQAFNDILENTKIGPWFYATKEAVTSHSGLSPA